MKYTALSLLLLLTLACAKIKIAPPTITPNSKNDTIDEILFTTTHYPAYDTTDNNLSVYCFLKKIPNATGYPYETIGYYNYSDTTPGRYTIRYLPQGNCTDPTKIIFRGHGYAIFLLPDSLENKTLFEVYYEQTELTKRYIAASDSVKILFEYRPGYGYQDTATHELLTNSLFNLLQKNNQQQKKITRIH